jgi:hypothetical protein
MFIHARTLSKADVEVLKVFVTSSYLAKLAPFLKQDFTFRAVEIVGMA